MPPGERVRQSVLFEASTVRRLPSFGGSAADLRPASNRLFWEASVPQPERPSMMSEQLRFHSRQARRSTRAPLLPRAQLPAH